MLAPASHARLLSATTPVKAAMLVITLGTLGLTGQLLNITVLTTFINGYPAMSISTALSLIFLAIALLSAQEGSLPFVNALALFIILTAAFSLALFFLGISQANLLTQLGLPPSYRILLLSSPYTAACLSLLGISFILQNGIQNLQSVRRGQLIALGAFFILITIAVGYLFSATILYKVNEKLGMAIPTLLSLLMLSIGMLNLHRDIGLPAFYYEQSLGGSLLKSTLPKLGLFTLFITFISFKLHTIALSDSYSYALIFIALFLVMFNALWRAAITLNEKQDALLAEENKFQALFNSNPDCVIVVDESGTIVQVNQQATALTGYSVAQLEGQLAEFLIPHALRHAHKEQRENFAKNPHPRTMGSNLDIRLLRADGTECPVDISIRPTRIANKKMNILSVRDLTERKRAEATITKLNHDAYHDPLTKLPNRRLMMSLLDQSINRAMRHQHQVAICYCDLDGFKQINDTFGHAAGDALLIEAANRMSDCVRKEDTVTRLGGDEFIIVLSEVSDKQGVVTVIEKVIEQIALPYHLTNGVGLVTISVGISLYPDNGTLVDELIAHADAAMYRAKQHGKNQYHFFA